jgi:hypothetical protein
MVASNGIPSGGSGGFAVPLVVAKGGTGQTTLTAHALLVGNGTTGILALAPSTARNVAISDGTDWASRALVAADIPPGEDLRRRDNGGAERERRGDHGRDNCYSSVHRQRRQAAQAILKLTLTRPALPVRRPQPRACLSMPLTALAGKGTNGFARTFDGTAKHGR